MKIERDSLRGEGSFYRPGASLLGERQRSTETLGGAVPSARGGIGVLADARLLQHYVRDGDQSAFTSLVEKYQSMVIGTALRHTGNAELAREVAQEVFAALARKARTLAKRDSLGGWLHRAALYEAIHVLKAETRRRTRNERFSNQMALFATPRANENRSAERLAVIDEALNDLSENDREALVLHYFQDLSYAEMAKALALGEPAARQRVSRALHHLELALRTRGYSGNALVLLLAAVAMDSSLAIPGGLSTAALALAQSGANSALPLFLSGLLPHASKTVALLLAVAGTALLWQTNRPALPTADAASIIPPAQRSAVELSREPEPVRFASAAQAEPAAPQTSSEVRLPAFTRQPGMARQAAQRPAPRDRTEPRTERRTAVVARPATSSPPAQRVAGDERSRAIPREAAEAPETLEAILEASPRLAWELRDAELLPVKAAELYTGLLTQLLALNDSQQLRVGEFLVGHFTDLGERNIVGRRPPDFPPADWREARQLAIEQVLPAIEAAAESDAPVIRTVLTLPDELEAAPDLDIGDGSIIDL